ncbi:DUF805 domain-containing protein [Enterobacter oligotrophicus]|uniref:DUF805 domain-containing protein n=1 Tax=Enterobacter TaxID=547 RepID=UPI0028A6613F|nr:DUF805 domain-containing protein [Enterobacter oligotrophicus]ELW1645474.1 DUF805 domain-containing protein [Enterobacter oligotrophicus]
MNKNVGTSYLEGWKKTFIYKGNATRQDFWSFILINIIVVLIIAAGSYLILVGVIADHTSRGGMALVWMYFVYLPLCGFVPLILFLPILSLGVRRMHDIGKSGWWFSGPLLIELVGGPIIISAVYYLLVKFLSEEMSLLILNVINMISSAIIVIGVIWLCCQPANPNSSVSHSEL